ncbi:Cof-type HAD-IIB family hydrolase [Microbacterium sp. zg.Y1090]|uniref:Cof-type HAD-IIB family hydrolase n=1 Tax=Microbacterium TaxID=33882 RepID=UPI00214ADFBE|nr:MULTISPECIES: Cof-type HAD-IIB family hydrolase [unclassified Microbacterium]MCR2812478.1 Cof-type HAD-IIB family hydrolase [Microbacterium sp. zg.Y1084]MCR2817721.1 Cof-type HAD-IIB family hydrolase [Microbacterium sp. zg.Y1090]MDL5485636.1 Cof-type HAD-IIB family hydrolase [Microbacterium sp. zg-Y1211]WIM28807.1 Cof-type HAD-IIB family hydrolase [Microbacterium sp. zg-Y1090]
MAAPDIRLIAVDMDGTLLDPAGRIPDGLWPLLDRLRERGIAFAPASGRQLATLQRSFGAAGRDLDYIAENGAYVVREGTEVSSDALDPVFVRDVILRLRGHVAAGDLRIGIVVCGKESAYIEGSDPVFRAEVEKYYARLTVVDDLRAVDDQVLKLAVFDHDGGEAHTAPLLTDVAATHQVVVSGPHWVDIMNAGVNKGVALRNLQQALGVDRAQTAAFGDYLNDIELLQVADWSYAMADAHPDVVAVANHRAPSNAEHGVITTIEALLG